MYQLLLKQRFKFAVRMVKRNIGAYLILIAIVPCILILQSMIQNNSGIDIKKWLHGFDSVEESVKESVELIKKHPLIPRDIKVHGLIMDSESGKLEVITKDY